MSQQIPCPKQGSSNRVRRISSARKHTNQTVKSDSQDSNSTYNSLPSSSSISRPIKHKTTYAFPGTNQVNPENEGLGLEELHEREICGNGIQRKNGKRKVKLSV